MKRFSFFTVTILASLLLSACGSPAAPTMNAADVQSTAQVAAITMVAQTQAAIPTATPLPPTEAPTQTPAVTDTPLALPTLASTLAVTLTSTTAPVSNDAGGDPCQTRVLNPERGRETVIRVVNETRAKVRVSMYLNETEAHGECGYRSFDLSKNNDIVFTDLVQGCYNLWAWSIDNQENVNGGGGGCINNSDKWTFEISANSIKFVGP
jgi:hypothetical protein